MRGVHRALLIKPPLTATNVQHTHLDKPSYHMFCSLKRGSCKSKDAARTSLQVCTDACAHEWKDVSEVQSTSEFSFPFQTCYCLSTSQMTGTSPIFRVEAGVVEVKRTAVSTVAKVLLSEQV